MISSFPDFNAYCFFLTKVFNCQFLWYTDKRILEELNLDERGKIDYTYKCLASGFYGLRSKNSFEKTLNDLIRYGGDADTNGAVCGTMYGARYGYRALPYEWLRAMPNKKWFDQILVKCLEKLNLNANEALEVD
jgi:ADP-ribosylglycohydrolase